MFKQNHTPPAHTTQDIFRFWDKVSFRTDKSCWIWTGHKSKPGYGLFYLNYQNPTRVRGVTSHRFAYFLMFKVWSRQCVLHKCDNPSCVNPFHLFEGTRSDNMKDMYAKGRGHKTPSRGGAKISEADVITIRSLWHGKYGDTNRLAAQFGLTRHSISHIVTKKSWWHI